MSRFFLFFTVFITGMCVMAIELTASRLLAPYFGASLFIWTNIISVVLLALSLGYYLGGKLADYYDGKADKVAPTLRRGATVLAESHPLDATSSPELEPRLGLLEKTLYLLIFITGLLVSLIPFVGKPIFLLAYDAISDRSASIFLGSLAATLGLFMLPLLLLGMVSPIAAKIGLKNKDNRPTRGEAKPLMRSESATIGQVIGSLYACSTLGSLIGTFLPVLLTIPFLGSRETFFLFGGVLIMLGVVGMRRVIFLSFLVIPILLFFFKSPVHADPNIIFQDESVYNYISVQEHEDGQRSLRTNEGFGIQSLYHPTQFLTGYYWDVALFLPIIKPDAENFLIVGSAGGTSARMLHHFFPSLALHAVEIDPLIVQVSKRFFGMDEVPMEITTADGRVFLQQTKEKYDLMMIDVYKDELYIPFHLATKEFFELAASRLSDDGVMMMNVASASANAEMVDLIKNTVTAVFPYTYELRETASFNTLLFAFKQKPDLSFIQEKGLPSELISLTERITKDIQPLVLSNVDGVAYDNRSAIEFLTEKMIFFEASRNLH